MKKICMLIITACILAYPLYCVMGLPANTLENVIVYPNPFQKNLGHTVITFDNLTPSVRIQIYKITGELVYNRNRDTVAGRVTWNVTNNQGANLASGVYIYLITNGSEERSKGKIVILR